MQQALLQLVVTQEGVDPLPLLLHLLFGQPLLTGTGAILLRIVNTHRRRTATDRNGIEHRIGRYAILSLILLHPEDDGSSNGSGP